ncbi:MAG TPA: hypothetical protein DCE56_17420 [Cyanobacteria bacterium UBA8553]|nr:hypothetical protein [Cyanobacteria bacterium UBA8553]
MALFFWLCAAVLNRTLKASFFEPLRILRVQTELSLIFQLIVKFEILMLKVSLLVDSCLSDHGKAAIS